MIASLSDNTLKQYNTCLKQWFSFCIQEDISLYSASLSEILRFLIKIYNQGGKYGTINSAKAALSLVLGSDKLNCDQIKRFMKGVYRLRMPFAKYCLTWDPAVVLNFLSELYPNENLDLQSLSRKIVTLIALITAHRVQTLSLIRLTNIKRLDDKIMIHISDNIKTSAVNRTQPILVLPFFNERPSICPARALERYLDVTKPQFVQLNVNFFLLILRNRINKYRLKH